ncbi:hypothetical protein GCM10009715_33710 [Paeniglutamicibacter psychrophenolicus]|uniref:Protein NO VEIN C-terminal domain-containing protein n=1 Tax=Paeniglutamicibacter psychrophenolicus TaxID=257454 RepID=A0ABS4W9T7_9MICC|nr:DUF3883 domain-containing protein [Paeniglutamicibacter psychrophenolicus]MBP2372958.1 hypothetical protein [Paeniglutamicibacter psychrophenolicus]
MLMNLSAVGTAWSDSENYATIEAYFSLFIADLHGEPINKAATYRKLAGQFGRAPKAFEFKMLNISAVLVRLGWPYLRGLMPKANYQGSLEIAVAKHIVDRSPTDFALLENSEPVEFPVSPVDLVLRPVPQFLNGGLLESGNPEVNAAKRDYAAIEAANSSLGLAGELAVAENETRLLFLAGHKKLANKVEHVSQTQGDGIGYDVLSFDANGRERCIEVKTSRYGAATPFFVTDNEVRVSERNPETYWLYRLYDFDDQARSTSKSRSAYRLHGNLRTKLDLRPISYRALPA